MSNTKSVAHYGAYQLVEDPANSSGRALGFVVVRSGTEIARVEQSKSGRWWCRPMVFSNEGGTADRSRDIGLAIIVTPGQYPGAFEIAREDIGQPSALLRMLADRLAVPLLAARRK